MEDYDIDNYDISEIFDRIEKELTESMMRNFDKHRAEEDEKGINWSQWQVEQLAALEQYKRHNAKKYKREFTDINKKIDGLIKFYRKEGNNAQEVQILEAIKKGLNPTKTSDAVIGKFFKLNDRKIDALIESLTNDFERCEVAMLRRANDQYRKIIFASQMYASMGGTYEKAVDMASKDFLRVGINCVEYKNGARHNMRDYADMAIRTACKRAYLTGEGEKRKEWGETLVIMNKRGNPCPKCFPWVGLILIDDVWSGGTASDGPYKLMSTAISEGLYHPRCKDSHSTYFPGITTVDEKTIEDSKRIKEDYEKEQKINYYRRQKEKCERIAEYSLDEDNKRMYQARAEAWEEKIEEFEVLPPTNKNGEEIIFNLDGVNEKKQREIKEIISSLSEEYNTCLIEVQYTGKSPLGAESGKVDVTGSVMQLNRGSGTELSTVYHEFAHTLDSSNRSAKMFAGSIETNQEYWKEAKKLFRKYKKDTINNSDLRISEYSLTNVDEFMAEAFVTSYGYEPADTWGIGGASPYVKEAREIIDKYFKKETTKKTSKIVEYRGGIPKKWKTIDTTKDNAVKNVNPKYGTGVEYSKNCPNCACAYEMRKRGYDVVAKPYTKGGSHYLNTYPWEAWKDADVQTITKKNDFIEYTQKQGNGSRFGIAIEYSDKSGHVIVGEMVDDVLKLYDAQTGKEVIDIDFDDINDVKLWKTNELDVSDRGITACEGR